MCHIGRVPMACSAARMLTKAQPAPRPQTDHDLFLTTISRPREIPPINLARESITRAASPALVLRAAGLSAVRGRGLRGGQHPASTPFQNPDKWTADQRLAFIAHLASGLTQSSTNNVD